jgi:hypothetical protein
MYVGTPCEFNYVLCSITMAMKERKRKEIENIEKPVSSSDTFNIIDTDLRSYLLVLSEIVFAVVCVSTMLLLFDKCSWYRV